MKKLIVSFIFTFCTSHLIYSQNYIINTVAGDGNWGYSGDGGPATNAELEVPPGVAADAAGNVYVADQANHRVRKVNTSGIISTFAGNGYMGWSGDGGPATAAELGDPWMLTLDKSGNLYFTDTYNYKVREVNTSGIITMFAGGGVGGDGGPASSAALAQPVGITFDNNGNFYIAEYSGNKIRIVNTNGIIETFAGGGSLGNGNPATAAVLGTPSGVAADRWGNVYISEENGNDVRVVNTSGIILAFAGTGAMGYAGDGGPATAAKMAEVEDVAVDSLGNVAIADYENNRIRIVNTSGIINTIAGNGRYGFYGDGGPATAAELENPIGVNWDPSGNLYIADSYNERIRELTNNTTTGIYKTEISDNSFSIYPNPTTGLFTVHSEGTFIRSTFEIYNLIGQRLYRETFQPVNNSYIVNPGPIPNGVYFYIIKDESGNTISNGKIVIEK